MLMVEMDVIDYMVTIENALMEDAELMDEIGNEIYEQTLEHDTPLYKLLTSELGVNKSDIILTVLNDDDDMQVYSGKADKYPYDYETPISMYHMYNIGNDTYLDVWGVFPKWRDIEK